MNAAIEEAERLAEEFAHAARQPVVLLMLRLQQHRSQRRAQRQRVERRDDRRDRDGQRELAIELAGEPADERDRHEYRAQHQRDRDDRAADFVHRHFRGFERTQPLFDVTFDVLDDDDGVVHHDADGKHQPEQR